MTSGEAKRARTPLSGKPRGREPVRLAIATQPALVRDLLARCLSREADLQIVGEAHDEEGIVALLPAVEPGLLLLDYEALGPNSESIIGRLRRLMPQTRILVIATRSSDESVERVLGAGASGLVGKQLGFETLVRAVRAVASGEVWLNRRAQAMTLEHLTSVSVSSSFHNGQLTCREHEIAASVFRGLRNKEIARQLSISEKTVKSHLNNIFQKLGLRSRLALAFFEQGQAPPAPMPAALPRAEPSSPAPEQASDFHRERQ